MPTNGMHFEQTKVQKFCQDCGKLEMMSQRSLYCAECKKKRLSEYKKSHYWNNREAYLERVRKNRAKKKEYTKHEKLKTYPVRFNCNNGRYSWEVVFDNPITGRKVLWKSARSFLTIMDAKKDFSRACGGK